MSMPLILGSRPFKSNVIPSIIKAFLLELPFIINRGLNKILLGMPFTIKAQLIYKYSKDRTITIVFKNSDRSKQGRLIVASDNINLGKATGSENK